MVIGPEIIILGRDDAGEDNNVLKGVLEFAMFKGDKIKGGARVVDMRLLAHYSSLINSPLGSEVELVIPWRNVIILPDVD